MIAMVRWDRSVNQVWISNQRIHHGALGVSLIVLSSGLYAIGATPLARASLAAGIVLCIDDWHDVQIWFQLGPQSNT